ncbi:MAG: radical SAM protein [Ilumatobacteraceae bacterium]
MTDGFVADTITFSNVDGPGNRFVVFTQGCNFDCVACHNPQTIPLAHSDHFRTAIDDLLPRIRRAAPFISGVTVSGGEATLQPAFVRHLFDRIKCDPQLHRLTCFVDSNGSADEHTWRHLDPVMDGAMIDLKCFDPAIHLAMTGQPNDAVLRSIELLAGWGKLHEVRLLVLKGVNDDPDLLRRTGVWLAGLDPAMRVKVIGFRRHGARPHEPELVEPSLADLEAAAAQLGTADLQFCVV